MKNYPSSCFVITANIDLDNHNWLPFRFSGKLDGQNNTISNLNISRNIDNQGLFSVLENNAYINNLTIKGITINAENNNCIGALCGNIYYGKDISINNITVILTEKSQIIGMNSVGGIVGYIDYAQNIEIANCYITSASSGYAIKGNNFVGGIAGNTHANYSFANNISACRVSASITGGDYVGGIVGSARYFEIQKCSYNGNIKANEYAGGIAGSSREYPIIACKTIADIISSSYAGGIIGFAEFANIIACYSVGSLNAPEGNGIFGYNKIGTAYLCYTTMSCGLGNTCIDSATTAVSGSGKNTVNLCTNITKHLQEAYSDYASYYNFDNTWMSDGVSCPRLAWENSN